MSTSARPVAGLSSSAAASSQAKPDRLYIGNLSSTVDEYTLIQLLQRYGSITNLDYMFHKSGALKGKPRGYAFVQFSSKDDALKAMVKLHDRLLRGRKLVVTYASSAPLTDLPLASKGRRSEPAKTTTLSLLKSQKKPHSAAAQIAAMEAKLASMQSRKPADEDYVPGQSFRVSPAVGSPGPSSQRVHEDDEMDLEEELGLDAGRRAAEDLEREMVAELEGKGKGKGRGRASPDRSRGPSKLAPPTTTPAEPTSSSAAPADHGSGKSPHLPAHRGPTQNLSPSRPAAPPKGLANLPKKPSFL